MYTPEKDNGSSEKQTERKKPNLFIIGFPKTGTTALHYILAQHPEVFMTPIKEPNFFCTDLRNESKNWYQSLGSYNENKYFQINTMSKYLNLFNNVTDEQIIGESSTNYIYSESSAKEIFEANSNSKIIIILREPVDFLFSFHSQLVKKKRENISNFTKALDAEESRRKHLQIPFYVRYPSILFYSEWVKYSKMIQRYLSIFPNKQVKIILYEEFKKDNLKTYIEILNFLKIREDFNPDFKILNKSESIENMWLRNFFTSLKESIKPIFSRVIRNKTTRQKADKLFNKALNKVSKAKNKTNKLDSKTRNTLSQSYREEIDKLSKLINIDLAKYWGYK